MCGIAGIVSLRGAGINALRQKLGIMDELIAHRGPDGNGAWLAERQSAGLVHRRLSIIDLSDAAAQPMAGANGTVITYNGEIYNYVELREALSAHWQFRTNSDTETILAAYARYGVECVDHLRG